MAKKLTHVPSELEAKKPKAQPEPKAAKPTPQAKPSAVRDVTPASGETGIPCCDDCAPGPAREPLSTSVLDVTPGGASSEGLPRPKLRLGPLAPGSEVLQPPASSAVGVTRSPVPSRPISHVTADQTSLVGRDGATQDQSPPPRLTHVAPPPATQSKSGGAPFARGKSGSPESKPAGAQRTVTHPPAWADRDRSGDWFEPDLVEEYMHLSRGLQVTRVSRLPSLTTPALRAAANTSTPFAPSFLLWVIDNHLIDGDLEGARAVAKEWEQQFPWDADFQGQLILDTVLRSSAACSMSLGERDRAERTLSRLLQLRRATGGDVGEAWFELGDLYEANGERTRAIDAYRRAAKAPRRPEALFEPDTARRAAARLSSTMSWVRRDPIELAQELLRALRDKDTSALADLATPYEFVLGWRNADTEFVDTNAVLTHIVRDLKGSRIFGNPDALIGEGGKLYFATEGWEGGALVGRVCLILRQVAGCRWEWGGLAPTLQGPESRALFTDTQPSWQRAGEPGAETKDAARGATQRRGRTQRLRPTPGSAGLAAFDIKAPWPAGLSFQAGGAWETFDHTHGRPCGTGTGGSYYGMGLHKKRGPTTFAIDFSRYGRFHNQNISLGTPVLAIAKGVVYGTQRMNRRGRGGANHANIVRQSLKWFDDPRPGPRPSRYTAHYFHLDGPGRLLVSDTCWVDQGFVLGYMDDTGKSGGSHLHFRVNDSMAPYTDSGGVARLGGSVMPSPLDRDEEGVPQILGRHSNGRCVYSTNETMNPRAHCLALVDWLDSWANDPITGFNNRVWNGDIERLAREWGYERPRGNAREAVRGLAAHIAERCPSQADPVVSSSLVYLIPWGP